MINCKRCDLEIAFDDSRCLSLNTGMPHDIRKCRTKPGYVYCPQHREAFLKTNACNHYLTYGWKSDHSEAFVLDLINKKYVEGDWFHRRNKKTSQYSGTLKNSVCGICDEKLNHLSFRMQKKHQNDCIKHQEEMKMQHTLF